MIVLRVEQCSFHLLSHDFQYHIDFIEISLQVTITIHAHLLICHSHIVKYVTHTSLKAWKIIFWFHILDRFFNVCRSHSHSNDDLDYINKPFLTFCLDYVPTTYSDIVIPSKIDEYSPMNYMITYSSAFVTWRNDCEKRSWEKSITKGICFVL